MVLVVVGVLAAVVTPLLVHHQRERQQEEAAREATSADARAVGEALADYQQRHPDARLNTYGLRVAGDSYALLPPEDYRELAPVTVTLEGDVLMGIFRVLHENGDISPCTQVRVVGTGCPPTGPARPAPSEVPADGLVTTGSTATVGRCRPPTPGSADPPRRGLPARAARGAHLNLLSTQLAFVATVAADGSPAATPVRFSFLGLEVVWTSWSASPKSRLRRDPRVSVATAAPLVGQASSRGVQVFGTARTLERDDPQADGCWEPFRWQSDHVERGRSLDDPPRDPLTVVTPGRIVYTDHWLRRDGYRPRQVWRAGGGTAPSVREQARPQGDADRGAAGAV